QLHDRAAVIAAELRAGDDCLVCHQPLPADFEPASATDAADLAAAKTLLNRARTARTKAGERLAEARADVIAADKAVLEREKELRDTQRTAQHAAAAAARAFEDLAALQAGTGPG